MTATGIGEVSRLPAKSGQSDLALSHKKPMNAILPTFALVWASVLFLPPAAFVLGRHVRSAWPEEARRSIIGATLVLVSMGVFSLSGFALTNTFANLILGAIGYFAWCYLVAYSSKIRRKILRIPVVVVGKFPIVCGYFIGTLGFPFLLFIANDIAQRPMRIVSVGSSFTCELTRRGFAPNTSSHMILYKQWEFAPFVKRAIAREVAFDLDEEEAMSCAAMLREHSGS